MTGKPINLIGKRVGRLLVIDISERRSKNREPYWVCLCDCGTIKEIMGRNLRGNAVKSCGCLQREAAKKHAKDLTGIRYGRWVVIERSGSNQYRKSMWNCRCDCGITKTVSSLALLQGKSKSCGCLAKDVKVTRFTTHGLSKTKEYKAHARTLRREGDSGWTLEMEQWLVALFPYCAICGNTNNLQTDHVYPLSKGYGLIPGNAARLCRKCNCSKNDRLPDELDTTSKSKLLRAAKDFKRIWESTER